LFVFLLQNSCRKEDNQSKLTVADIDGNIYNTITIGTKIWMAENLETTRYADGTPIPFVNTNASWDALDANSKAYCWYNDNINNKDTYGALYTWAAAMKGEVSSSTNPSGVQGVCPTAWHLPSNAEWAELETYLGGNSIAGFKLKETGKAHWNSSTSGVTNESGFTALPGGYRYYDGDFKYLHVYGFWWSSSENTADLAWYMNLEDQTGVVYRYSTGKKIGFSVRCLSDKPN